MYFQIGHEQAILHQWLDCGFTSNGLLVAKQKVGKLVLVFYRID